MAEIRETHVERDNDGRVVDTRVTEHKKGGGFGIGMLLGVVIIAGAVIAFAYSQGSFRNAGVQADQATSELQDQSQRVAANAGDLAEDAGDAAQNAGQTIEQNTDQLGDTATN